MRPRKNSTNMTILRGMCRPQRCAGIGRHLDSRTPFGGYLLEAGREGAAVPSKPISEAALVVGRRGGKSRVLALIAVYLACFRDYAPYLAPGEVATIAVLAANRPQARSIFRYISGLLKAVSLFKPMVLDENQESIVLSNRVVIEVATASFRTSRGYSFAAVLADEVAFWRSDESSANPDIEIMRALRPGMASIPGSILMLASSPYAKKSELYAAFRRHFGKHDARVCTSCDTGLQKLQLPHQPPRHEKNADTDSDGEQHIDHCTTHSGPAAIASNVFLISAFPS
jgi:hypothetical protein